MKKLLTFLTLLTLSIGVGWAAESVFYTLTPAAGSNNSYASDCDVEIGGITWNVTGNAQMTPWRIGGKSLTNVDRAVYSKTAMGSAISKVELTVGDASSITVNSLKLTVASDANFNNVIEVVTNTFADNSTITFTPTSGEWVTGAYYKFTFNVTVSGTRNKFVEFSGATFYMNDGGSTPQPTTYSLTLPNGLTGGTVTSDQSNNSAIVAGTSVTVTATPETGYELDWMKANDTDVSNPYTFNINANTTITAAFKETQVTPPSTDQYQLVTDASQLAAGDKIIIVNTDTDGSGKAMSTTQNTNNRGVTDVSISNSIITPGSSVQIITLEKDGENWLFNVGSGYLYAASSSSNHLKTKETPDDNAKATISITSNAATVTFQGTNTRNLLKYNSNSDIFSCYASGQQDIFIYKKVEATPQANDVYIIGQVNGHDSDPWVSTEGVKMTYNSSNDNYAANIYCTGVNNGTHEGYSLFLFAKSLPYDWNTTSNLYGSGADGSYWPISGLSGESAFDEEIPLYEGSKNSYRLPAGLYTVTVDLDYTGHEYTTKSVKVTKRDVTMTISPSSASFEDTKTVTMSSNLTEIGGKIYYTTNGNDPRDPNSGRQEYTGELTIDATTTFKAVAYVGNLYSEVVEKTYTKTPAAPVISPASCTFNEPLTVTITAESGATIYYTTDGSTPTNESTQYTGSFTVSTTTTVKARAYVDEVYSTIAEATYTYSNVTPSTGDFVLVTSADQLVAGNEYIILEAGGNYAMGAIGSNKGASTNAYTLNGTLGATGSTVSLSTGSDVNVLTLGGEDGAWTLQQSDNSYVSISGNSTNITSSSSAATVTIAIDNNYATIKGYSTRQILYQISGDKFANYASSNATGSDYEKIYLYTRASNAVAAPVFSPNSGLFNVDVDVTISCATDGATIYYTTDGTEPSATNGTEYTGEIIVSENTTFKAIAVKGENSSSVVTADYTIQKSSTIETVTLTYSEPFTSGIGSFTVDNVSGYSPVWSLDGNYGVKGTAYNAHTNPTNNAAVSRLVSPIIDMTGAVQPELTFSHQINSYFTNVTNQCQLFIRETTDGLSGTWVQLPITFSDPVAAGGWTNDVVDIDLSDYADKMVQISFLYTNPTAGSGAGTWEIQNFVVADNSEYRMVNNIAEFLALENGTKAKFKNPVTVLYDYAQYSSNSYHEYIWVKDNSGYMQFYLVPTLNSSTESSLDVKAAYYENGDIIPAGFVVLKYYYENGKYEQASSAEALEAGFLPATQKGLADPDHYEFSTLNALTLSDADIAANCNRYITLEKIKITSKSGKSFRFADENGTVNACVGYNKYNGDGSLLKDGTTSADVTVPDVSDTYYNVKGIIQLWQGGWELMPIEFTEWKADEVTLRKLCADGEVNNEYIISNNLQVVRADDATNTIWVKDDTGQSIWLTSPADTDDNYEYEIVGNTRPTQAYYDQSNWCEIVLANGSDAASSFVNKIIKGGMIDGTFVDKLNPKMTGVTLNADAVTSTATYVPNYYGPANFYSDQHQTCAGPMKGTEGHGTFFFMNPKPQEVARIAWAVYNGTQMALPAQGATGEYTDNQGGTHEIQLNGHGFQGAFKVNMGLNADQTVTLQQGKGYSNFDAIIRLETTGGSGAPMLKAAKPDGANYVVYPLNITGETLTGIDAITVNDASREVVATEYYNVAGQRSDRPVEGVNIIVTRYSDGSTTTAKVLK